MEGSERQSVDDLVARHYDELRRLAHGICCASDRA